MRSGSFLTILKVLIQGDKEEKREEENSELEKTVVDLQERVIKLENFIEKISKKKGKGNK